MMASKDFIIVHTLSERRTIHGDDIKIERSENRMLKKYVGNDEHVIIPDGIHTIGPRAFEKCEHMKSVLIPDSVKTIGAASFSECIHLESVRIPRGVKTLGGSAFSECTNLRSAVFEGEIPWYGCDPRVFWGCPHLTIYASKDSYIKRYAKHYKIPFVAI